MTLGWSAGILFSALAVILNERLHKIGNEQPTAAIQVDPSV